MTTELRLYDVPPIEGRDDYLPDDGLAAVARAIDRLPRRWEIISARGRNRSVVATIEFTCVGPMAQAQALEDALWLTACVRTLHANLVAARAALTTAEIAEPSTTTVVTP